MKLLKNNSCFILLFAISLNSMAQYVTLKGKQFKDENGNDFYPLVCNYVVDFAKDASGNYFLMPYFSNGSNPWPGPGGYYIECNGAGTGPGSCHFNIRSDFNQIKKMGFNSIRLMGAELMKSDTPYPPCPSSPCNVYKDQFNTVYKKIPFILPTDFDFLTYSAPYNTDPNLSILLAAINDVMNAANEFGLKVILIPGGGKYLLNTDTEPLTATYSGATIQDRNAEDYAAILSAYTSYFRNTTNLLAYDLWNEPGGYYEPFYFHTKNELCEWSTMWYNKIKESTNDPNHLITIGLFSFEDTWQWDVGVIKMDFVSPHIYPYLSAGDGYNTANGFYRYSDRLAWLQNNCPLPWIIGETGAESQATPGFYGNNESEQASFTDFALKATRDAGGSGYSCWVFSEADLDHLGLIKQVDALTFDATCNCNIYNPATSEKLAVAKFENYLTPPSTGTPPPIAAFPGRSPIYYNPYNHPPSPNTISGNVKDQNGLPIEDAYIFGYTPIEINTSTGKIIYDLHYTFSDVNGDFNLIPFDYKPTDPPNSNDIEDFKISAVGTDRIERGWNTISDEGTNTNLGSCNVTGCSNSIILSRGLYQNNALVNNIIVSSVGNSFFGGNNLDIKNVTVLYAAQTEFKARENINVNAQFHAISGSETHLYIAETFPDCPDFSSYRSQTQSPSVNNSETTFSSEIEIKFLQPKNQFGFFVYPNPGKDIFNVEIFNPSNLDSHYQIKVVDLIGKTVYSSINSLPIFQLDLTELAKGIYYIQINSKTQKLIIQ